jgi:DNA-binding transcriptional regulator YiaG
MPLEELSPAQIKAIRKRAGLSARELAEVLGLAGNDGRHIRFLESGERTASGPLIRLLEMLDRGELPRRFMPVPRRRGRPPIED